MADGNNNGGQQIKRTLLLWLSIFSALWVAVGGFLLNQYIKISHDTAILAERVTRQEERLTAYGEQTTAALKRIEDNIARVFELRLRQRDER